MKDALNAATIHCGHWFYINGEYFDYLKILNRLSNLAQLNITSIESFNIWLIDRLRKTKMEVNLSKG